MALVFMVVSFFWFWSQQAFLPCCQGSSIPLVTISTFERKGNKLKSLAHPLLIARLKINLILNLV
ncbi:MAG: hypothetical protein LLG04_01520, partial [Parachlamydia sp.]|nr:hypothetical protein [Parachlamydia sp.]